MNNTIQKLLDAELLDYREAYILNERIHKKTFEEIADDLKISRQRVNIIYNKIKYRMSLPKVQEVIFGVVLTSPVEKLESILMWDIPEGARLKLMKYGITKKNLKSFNINEIASIKGISIPYAKKLLKK